MATAVPGNDQSTHHVVLTSGATSVGLMICNQSGDPEPLAFTREDVPSSSLRIYSGAMKHHDRDSIMEPIAQTDWSGGRGSADFDKDTAKYGDGFCVDTTKAGQVILSGFPAYAEGARTGTQLWPWRGITWVPVAIDAGHPQLAGAFTTAASFTPAYIYLYLRGGDSGFLSVRIYSNLNDAPNNLLYHGITSMTDKPDIFIPKRIAVQPFMGAGALSGSTVYWVVIDGSLGSSYGWELLCADYGQAPSIRRYINGVWTPVTGVRLYQRVMPNDISMQGHFFEYKGSMWCATRNADGAVSKLYLNGDQGVVTGAGSNTTTLKDTSKSWTTNQFYGAVCRIISGTGSEQARPWREIYSNDATTLKFDTDPWDIAPVAGSTQYAIISTDIWQPITTSWSSRIVTDVLAANGAVYFACTDSVNMQRMVCYNNAGTWTRTFTDEDFAFTYLEQVSEQAGTFVYGAKAGTPATVSRAPAVDWTAGTGGTKLAFGTAMTIGNLEDRITGLERYGDYGNLHIMKRSGVYQLIDGKPFLYNARALEATSDYRNGRAVLAYDTFLYFSWHNSLLRYFRGMLDRIGPDRDDDPLPEKRTGAVMALAGYSNIIYAAFDAGPKGYSSIMAYNGSGWCEVYRAPDAGMRIWSLKVQTIDGDAVDRLWFTCGSDIMWIPLSVDPYNHSTNTYSPYAYAPGGELISAWEYNELNEILKYWHTVEVQAELPAGSEGIGISYCADDGTTYTDMGTATEYVDEIPFSTSGLAAYRVRVRYALSSPAPNKTPRITAIITEAIKRLPKTYATTFNYRVADDDVDRLGNPDSEYTTALARYNAVTALEEAATPVTVSSMIKSIDGKKAFIEQNSQRPIRIQLADGKEAYLVQVQLIEV